jgi:hypothetical protein
MACFQSSCTTQGAHILGSCPVSGAPVVPCFTISDRQHHQRRVGYAVSGVFVIEGVHS